MHVFVLASIATRPFVRPSVRLAWTYGMFI